MPSATKETLFKALSPGEKARNTDNAARTIIDAEASARDKKTARLREARLAQEALTPPPAPAPKKTRAKRA
ncbi:MAG TPA: hypothetical protein VGN97_10370 [Mesorhizobium sp.]|jgi:hypothetical protein|nr:hypothetical protein [Mesorhizobium sp.]